MLVESSKDVAAFRKIRELLVSWYVKLRANQDVFYTALFYLERYVGSHAIPSDGRPLALACLYLARKYQKGHSPRLDQWEKKLSYKVNRGQILELED